MSNFHIKNKSVPQTKIIRGYQKDNKDTLNMEKGIPFITSWWLNHPFEKYYIVKLGILSPNKDQK